MAATKIDYVTDVLNIITGCDDTFTCFDNCWAKRMALRLKGRCGYDKDNPFKPTFHADKLLHPLKWRKPRMVSVNWMGDMFLAEAYGMKDKWRDNCFSVLGAADKKHRFLYLSKRTHNMMHYVNDRLPKILSGTPRENFWFGTSVSSQVDTYRLNHLVQMQAAVRFVSVEPMVMPIDLSKHLHGLQWVVVGCESDQSKKRRALPMGYVDTLVAQCKDYGVPVFVKQLDMGKYVSHKPEEWPEELRVREYPKTDI